MNITTEYVYFGGYAFVVVFSLATVYYARRAARMDELEEERKRITEEETQRGETDDGDATEPEAAKGDDSHE